MPNSISPNSGFSKGENAKKDPLNITAKKFIRRHHGDARRKFCVSVRFNEKERDRLKEWASGSRRKMGELLREIWLSTPPSIVPENNQKRWDDHARTLSNLNQITRALNEGRLSSDFRIVLAELTREVHALRAELRGEQPVKMHLKPQSAL